MDKQHEKVIVDAFNSSHEKTKKFIKGDEYENTITNLHSKYNLTDDESTSIQIRTLYILLNLEDEITSKQEIILALRNRTAAETEKITKEIEEKILVHR